MVFNGVGIIVVLVALSCIAKVGAQTEPNPCLGIRNGFIDDYTSCASYFACVSGFTFPQRCPDPLWFDTRTNFCDFPSNVDCQHCPPTGSLMKRLDNSCRGYVRCNNGNAVKLNCELGLWFNPTNLVCDNRASVDCVNNHDCPANGDTYVGAVGDSTCLRYDFCSNGQLKGSYSCARDLFFNTALGRCVATPNCPQ